MFRIARPAGVLFLVHDVRPPRNDNPGSEIHPLF